MNLTILSHPRAVCVQARFTDRDDAIRQLTQRLTELGKITDADAYLAEVFHRESLGPTALGEGLAVPHGKSSAVKEAAFAVATLSEPMDWEGIDGPESVELIFLLAIPPDEAGSTHIQILTELTTCLADEDLRARVMAATSAEAVLAALVVETPPQAAVATADAPTIVCVTACPAGIAHTYMAAEYLEKAGRQMGVNVVVEKQGANGIEDRLTAQQLNDARACIFAAEVAIKESERFNGIPAISVPVAEPLRHAKALIEQALALEPLQSQRVSSATDRGEKGAENRPETSTAERNFVCRAVNRRRRDGTGGGGIDCADFRPTGCVQLREILAVDVSPTRRRDAGHADGSGTVGLYRVFAGG